MPIVFWLLIIIVSVLILIELQPKKDDIPHIDKFEHAFVFILLTITGCLAYSEKKSWVYAGLIALGTLYEVQQALFTVTPQAGVYNCLAENKGIF